MIDISELQLMMAIVQYNIPELCRRGEVCMLLSVHAPSETSSIQLLLNQISISQPQTSATLSADRCVLMKSSH